MELANAPSEGWRSLTETDLTDRERDHRAILAMAGPYRTTFDFIETLGFTPGYRPGRPYQSWGTEFVYVVADEPDFISLQHILVMVFRQEDGTVSEPLVVKHWRQDWRYQDRELFAYAGHDRWQEQRRRARAVSGYWSQAVFQVDDSPRYEALGRWVHHANHSTWESELTWRPLPRRELSVRDDYHVLEGTNRITITPTGWVQEEDNLKLVLDAGGKPSPDKAYLAREAGLSRYQRITGYDFSAGDAYWQRTGPFWREVRDAWSTLMNQRETFQLRDQVHGQPLFAAMFALAEQFAGEAFDRDAARRQVQHTLARYLR